MVPPLLVINYIGAFLPFVLLPWAVGRRLVPAWTVSTMLVGVLLCAFTWEIFVTYGLAGGRPFDVREPPEFPVLQSNAMNWLVMSMMDTGIVLHVLMMGAAVKLCAPHDASIFKSWRADVMCIFFVIGYGQGVGIALLHRLANAAATPKQLPLSNDNLSWMPLSPFLPLAKDPVIDLPILRYGTYRIMWPWVFLPFLWQGLLIHLVHRAPIPYPLVTFTAALVAICSYMVYFATVFPTCGSPEMPVPSVPFDPQRPLSSWGFLLRGLLTGFGVLTATMLASAAAAFTAGQLRVPFGTAAREIDGDEVQVGVLSH